jgi:hypothetical protein
LGLKFSDVVAMADFSSHSCFGKKTPHGSKTRALLVMVLQVPQFEVAMSRLLSQLPFYTLSQASLTYLEHRLGTLGFLFRMLLSCHLPTLVAFLPPSVEVVTFGMLLPEVT